MSGTLCPPGTEALIELLEREGVIHLPPVVIRWPKEPKAVSESLTVVNPVHPKHELAKRLLAAFGITFPTEKVTIEIDAKSHVRVHVTAPVDVASMLPLCEAFEWYVTMTKPVVSDSPAVVEAR